MDFPKEYPISQFIKHLNLLCQHYEQGVPVGFAEVQLKENLECAARKVNIVEAILDNKQVLAMFQYKVFPNTIQDPTTPTLNSETFHFQYLNKHSIKIEIEEGKVFEVEISTLLQNSGNISATTGNISASSGNIQSFPKVTA